MPKNFLFKKYKYNLTQNEERSSADVHIVIILQS